MAADDLGSRAIDVGGDVAAAVLAVVLGSQAGDPAMGALTAAAAQPVLSEAVQGGIRELAIRRQRQIGVAVEVATDDTGLSTDELVERLLTDPTRSEIFRLGLIAASNTGYEEKARAVGRSLATGALENDRAMLDLEALFLRAMQDIDPPHVTVLVSFTRSSREVGLGEGDEPAEQWNSHQVELIHGDRYGDALPALTAVLEGHGLLRRMEVGGGGYGGGGPMIPSWAITPLGRFLLERLRELGRE